MKKVAVLVLAIALLMTLAVFSRAVQASPSVILSPNNGKVGTTVTVTISGFPATSGTAKVNASLAWPGIAAFIASALTDSAGTWTATFVVPQSVIGAVLLTAYNNVTGTFVSTATAIFTILPSLKAGTVTRALPGDNLTLTGNGYAANSAVTVKFSSTTLATPVSITLAAPVITTNATGSFTTNITVPGTITMAQFDSYTITATDAGANTANVSILINYYIIANPSTSPPGVTTLISGRISANTAYDIRIDGVTILTGTSASDGRFSQNYVIPIATGVHTLSVYWASVNSASTTLTVQVPPTATLSTGSGSSGSVVTVTVAGFVARANVTLTFNTTVVNSTALDSRFGPINDSGALSASFQVPNVAPGAYTVKVTDQFGASATVVGSFLVLSTIPEFPSTAMLVLFVMVSSAFVLAFKGKHTLGKEGLYAQKRS